MLGEVLMVLVGVIIILLLAELIIRNSLELAAHYGLSDTFVGLTILSIGTSIPEIMTHIIGSITIVRDPSTFNALSSLLLGTNIGSDIFQQNFLLPVVGLVGTLVVVRRNMLTEMGGLIAAAVLVWLVALGGLIGRLEGVMLFLAYLIYLYYLHKRKIGEDIKAENHLNNLQLWQVLLLIIVCFIVMAFVADNVLEESIVLVESLPISASFFGIILLGVASALPELTTSLIAVLKKKKDISAGILIGSNITNPLFGIGLGALISTYTVPNVIAYYDLPVKIATAGLIYYFLWDKKLQKRDAYILIALFIAYLIVRNVYFPVDF